ncbi:hypothetical protein BJX99DRAFT_263435 [Aspergillus californicus]
MPTSSTLFDYSITNFGPLTTAFTVPASCASTTSTAIAFADEPNVAIWQQCDPHPNICLPTPTDSGALETALEINRIFGDGRIGGFYSPGPSCPSGWETAGAAGRNADGILSRSGYLATSTISVDSQQPVFYNPDDVLLALLDPSETAVWCCPESMAIGEMGYCYSTLPDLPFSTACQTFYTLSDLATYTTGIPGDDGQTTEGEIELITVLTTGTVTRTTFAASDMPGFVAVSQVDPIVLVHQPTDLSGQNDGDTGDEESPNETNAAGRVGVLGGGSWGVVVWVVGSVVLGGVVVLLR